MVEAQTILDEAPAPVNDWGADLHIDLAAVREGKLLQFDVSRLLPFPNATHLDPFLLVNHGAMVDTSNFDLIRPGAVAVEEHLLVLQPLVRDFAPLVLTDRARARRPLVSVPRMRQVRIADTFKA